MRLLAAGVVALLFAGVTFITVIARRGTPDSRPGTLRDQNQLLEPNALAPDPGEARKAMDIARRYLGDPMRELQIVGRGPAGEYLLEDEAGFCLAVRSGYWPEVSKRSVKPSGRFAASQALGRGC